MNLKERINQDLKEAMKSGDKIRLETIRSIRALILEFEKSGIGREMNQDDEVKILSSAVKKRKDSIEQFRNAGREELASKEEKELGILISYLPKQLSEEEILIEVKRIAAEIGAKSKEDFPKLMPVVMKELKGKAEGKLVKSIVEKYLG
jgi:uncharacterized protein YqeY